MEHKSGMTRRGRVRAVSFLAAVIAVLGAGTVKGACEARQYRRQLQSVYTRSAGEAAVYAASISDDLSKSLYAGTPAQLSAATARLWRSSAAAKSALSSLPVYELELDGAWRFLSQVGDYAMAMSRKSLAGQELTEEEIGSLQQLLACSQSMSGAITALEEDLSLGLVDLEELSREASLAREEGEARAVSSYQGFEELEQSFEGYPTLIYDGPFSDHILEKESRLLASLPEVSREEARRTAAKALGVEASRLSDAPDEESRTPAYVFTGGEGQAAVTKQGGMLCYLLRDTQPEEGAVSREEAMAAADAFLLDMGYESMARTYHEAAGNRLTINYAYETQGVLCYTDLIKVTVDLTTGRVASLDARGYLVNHYQRQELAPAITREEAAGSVNGRLTVENVRLALIPSPGLNEILAYEFTTLAEDGSHVLVYVNALTGAEEQILLLIESPDGVLTK